jgi:hypothetical protein
MHAFYVPYAFLCIVLILVRSVRISDVETLQDDMQDLMDDANDIQELMGRAFSMPGEINALDLDEEFAALGDSEMIETNKQPSFIVTAPSVPLTEPIARTAATRERPVAEAAVSQ